ncbi:WD40-repeat-containing domain protein [Syncephalis pseudoplumigaleata]|uniref:WD40-repeat-containing domain protein n=1 Tax=Syncephalis pseudoplumigaleata TaxID=1712513 RepID=A0A4P9YWK8_9FUNG|nr:WD40-repeat-containing domain protein [Syncephalis pseudoplumigaleata]|eukprot:RKP24407.1 WD40-repeat-containing domain protein [Syncephalis pseudoplumigaleata]
MPDRVDADALVDGTPAVPTDIFRQSLSIPVSRACCSMSMAPSSRDVALASRYGLHILDLTAPLEPACYLRYETCWDPVEVRWSPHRARENWVATTSNQRVLIWNVQASPNHPVEVIIPGHKRAVSDLHWSPYQPNMLATGALDTDVHLWDMRTPNRPVVSLCAWTAGAARVQYNRKNEFVIASAHAHMVKIWDTRKGTAPTTEIMGHNGKINYIWNVQQPKECHGTITTSAPVRLARYTPFGPAILSAAQRLDPTLRLWSRDPSRQEQPVHTFTGSTEPFRKFGWRIQNDLEDEFQLVALSLDGHLRLYHVSSKITASKYVTAKQRPTHSLKQPVSAVMSYRGAMHVPPIPAEDAAITTAAYYPVTSLQSFSTGYSTSGSCTPVTGMFPTTLPRSY